jgi:hypothetical protein
VAWKEARDLALSSFSLLAYVDDLVIRRQMLLDRIYSYLNYDIYDIF